MKTKIADKFMTQIKTKTIIKYLCEFAVGFILANIVIDRNFAPFGIAFAANCGVTGLIGTVLGHISGSHDVWRYLIAVVVAFAARHFLSPVLNISRETGSFLYCLWAVLVAGIGGVFIYSYSFKENTLFVPVSYTHLNFTVMYY